MCFPKPPPIPKVEALPERQAARPPNDSALQNNRVESTRRRLGFANMQFTPVAGLAPAVLTGKTLLGS